MVKIFDFSSVSRVIATYTIRLWAGPTSFGSRQHFPHQRMRWHLCTVKSVTYLFSNLIDELQNLLNNKQNIIPFILILQIQGGLHIRKA